jgi:hypothetical protein
MYHYYSEILYLFMDNIFTLNEFYLFIFNLVDTNVEQYCIFICTS